MERTQLEHLEDWLSRDDHKGSPWFHIHDLLRTIESIKKQSDSNNVASSQPSKMNQANQTPLEDTRKEA